MSDRHSQHALPIGYRLRWFQIECILGVGGFGIIYLARAGAILKGLEDVLVPATMAGEGRYSARFLYAIDRALALQPEARPQTIAEWRVMSEQRTDADSGAVDFSVEAEAPGTGCWRLTPTAGMWLVKRPCASMGRQQRNPYR